MLQIEYQSIAKDQWLSQTKMFQNGTPSGYIIFKVLPNLGATHGEIKLYLWRHSIIMEPNVPVIEGKQSEVDGDGNKVYPNMLGVYGGVSKAAVIRYLKSDITPKKIVCTPEAYRTKVRPAIQEVGAFDLYKDFFLLLDECDKLTTENDYRQQIILPMEDFFFFDKKAMVSATALVPSDPRFKQYGFKILKIVPKYDYKKNINVISTNNVIGTLKKVLDQCPNERHFIFVNSADLMYSIAKSLEIMDECKAFCASKSVKKLLGMGFKNASESLGGYKKVNMLSSRFFSAVDIKLHDEPNVIVISSVFNAPHTIVDPYTDVVQISGRLRNGVARISHITNYNPAITYLDTTIALKQIQDGFSEYKAIASRLDSVDTEGGKIALTQATQRMDLKKFVSDDHELLTYMVDNHLHEQEVRSYYRASEYLTKAYRASNCFNVKPIDYLFDITDSQLYHLTLDIGRSELIELVSSILHSYESKPKAGIMIYRLGVTVEDLRLDHPSIVKAYDALGGYSAMKSLNFDQAKINRAITKIERKNERFKPEMVKEIKGWYKCGDIPLELEIQTKLIEIFDRFKVSYKASATNIKLYYEADRSTNANGKKVWLIRGIK